MINNNHRPFRIRSKYYRVVATLTGVLLLLAIVSAIYITTVQSQLNEERRTVTEKFMAVQSLEDTLTDVLFRARGYYAFQDQNELEQLYLSLDQFQIELEDFKHLELTNEEVALQIDLNRFYENYTTNLLPLAISYVENDDYESLRALSSGGANAEINNFLNYTNRFKASAEVQREEIYEEVITVSNQFKIIVVAIGAFSIFLMIFIVGKLLNEIVSPIEALSRTTKAITKGEKAKVVTNYPPNEIGILAEAFREMMEKVSEKEKELLAQNEELLSQQDELQDQQEKLRNYLSEIENIKKALDQSASVCITDDKGVILSVNDRFSKATQYDKEELVGNTTRILKSGYHPESFYKYLWETISNGKIWQKIMKNKRKDDSFFWVNATIVPYLDDEGKPYQYILIGIDVTETKNVQQKLKQYLEEMKRTKEKIEKYSSLNQYLTMTLDKEKFLDIVFKYFNEVYEFDKGILVHIKGKKYRSKGLSKTKIQELIDDKNQEEIFYRLKKEKFFLIKRKAHHQEKGMAEGDLYCYDLYSSILSTDGTVEGYFAITRIGTPFQEEEVEEINGLMKQLTVALSRINIYEEVENAKNLNENIIENVNEGLQLVSLDGEMLQYNKILIDLLSLKGYINKFKIEKEIWVEDFIGGVEDKDKLREFFYAALKPLATKSKTLRFTLQGDEQTFVELYASPVLMHGQKIGTIFVYRDITKEYEVDQMKSELVSTVSHELRTPLSSVLGFSEMLLMKELKPERQKKYLETIYKEATRLTNLINDFLDLQRMESGKQEYRMELHSINEIAMEGIEKFKHESKYNINIVDNARFTKAMVDRDRITQVFTNLISNSIKFSPEGGDITITLKNHNNALVISIKDKGIGIPTEALPTIFDKFKRIDNTETRKIGGTGLGLSICKEIIEAHRGNIRIESEERKGTTVHFSLPLEERSEELSKALESGKKDQKPSTPNPNVMLVEDDISLALLLSESLKSKGFTVYHYIHPQSALKDAEKIHFLGVVVDLMLGDEMTGWDLIKELNKGENTKDIPIIISSAIEKSEESLKKCNVYDYLVKPYPSNRLVDIMLEIERSQKDS